MLAAKNTNQWLLTEEDLANTASRKQGYSKEDDLQLRQSCAILIKKIGDILKLSQFSINTAIVYMHRFYVFHPFSYFDWQSMSSAFLILGAKATDNIRYAHNIIQAQYLCLDLPAPQSDEIDQIADELFLHEKILLKTLGTDLTIEHPHPHIVDICKLVNASKSMSSASYFLASISLHLTLMCLKYSPKLVACFCVHMACKWTFWEIPKSRENKFWYQYVDESITSDSLNKLTTEFLTIYENTPTDLKETMNKMYENVETLQFSNASLLQKEVLEKQMTSPTLTQGNSADTKDNETKFLNQNISNCLLNCFKIQPTTSWQRIRPTPLVTPTTAVSQNTSTPPIASIKSTPPITPKPQITPIALTTPTPPMEAIEQNSSYLYNNTSHESNNQNLKNNKTINLSNNIDHSVKLIISELCLEQSLNKASILSTKKDLDSQPSLTPPAANSKNVKQSLQNLLTSSKDKDANKAAWLTLFKNDKARASLTKPINLPTEKEEKKTQNKHRFSIYDHYFIKSNSVNIVENDTKVPPVRIILERSLASNSNKNSQSQSTLKAKVEKTLVTPKELEHHTEDTSVKPHIAKTLTKKTDNFMIKNNIESKDMPTIENACQLPKPLQLQNGQLQNCIIQTGQLQNGQLPNGLLHSGQLQNNQLQNRQLQNGQPENAQLQKEQLHNRQLQHDQFQNGQSENVQFQYGQLQTPQLQNSQLQNGQLPNGQLQNEKLQNGQLQDDQSGNTQLQKTQLHNGQLKNGKFQNGQLQNSQLPNGQLQNDQHQNTQLQKVKLQNGQLQHYQLKNGQLPKNQIQNYQLKNGQLQNDQLQNSELLNGQHPNGQIKYGQSQNDILQNSQTQSGEVPNGQVQNFQLPNSQLQNDKLKNSELQDTGLHNIPLQNCHLQNSQIQNGQIQKVDTLKHLELTKLDLSSKIIDNEIIPKPVVDNNQKNKQNQAVNTNGKSVDSIRNLSPKLADILEETAENNISSLQNAKPYENISITVPSQNKFPTTIIKSNFKSPEKTQKDVGSTFQFKPLSQQNQKLHSNLQEKYESQEQQSQPQLQNEWESQLKLLQEKFYQTQSKGQLTLQSQKQYSHGQLQQMNQSDLQEQQLLKPQRQPTISQLKIQPQNLQNQQIVEAPKHPIQLQLQNQLLESQKHQNIQIDVKLKESHNKPNLSQGKIHLNSFQEQLNHQAPKQRKQHLQKLPLESQNIKIQNKSMHLQLQQEQTTTEHITDSHNNLQQNETTLKQHIQPQQQNLEVQQQRNELLIEEQLQYAQFNQQRQTNQVAPQEPCEISQKKLIKPKVSKTPKQRKPKLQQQNVTQQLNVGKKGQVSKAKKTKTDTKNKTKIKEPTPKNKSKNSENNKNNCNHNKSDNIQSNMDTNVIETRKVPSIKILMKDKNYCIASKLTENDEPTKKKIKKEHKILKN